MIFVFFMTAFSFRTFQLSKNATGVCRATTSLKDQVLVARGMHTLLSEVLVDGGKRAGLITRTGVARMSR